MRSWDSPWRQEPERAPVVLQVIGLDALPRSICEHPIAAWRLACDLLGFQIEAAKPSMQGWATPRKRPRRVAKKVAKRGYEAHYGRARFGASCWVTEALRAGERMPDPWPVPEDARGELIVNVAPYMLHEGKRRMVPDRNQYTAFVRTVPRLGVPRCGLDSEWPPDFRAVAVEQVRLEGRKWGYNESTARTSIDVRGLIYASEADFKRELEDIEDAIRRRSAGLFACHLTRRGRLVAAQTSYRPIKRAKRSKAVGGRSKP